MTLGIVGSEGLKFNAATEGLARDIIRDLILRNPQVQHVVSGACHLGGIDVWAIQEATKLKRSTREYPPLVLNWSKGYRLRNIQIAQAADEVVCITLRHWPEGWTGMRWDRCYHCAAGSDDHVKSGGCWTMKFAESLGKQSRLIIIEN